MCVCERACVCARACMRHARAMCPPPMALDGTVDARASRTQLHGKRLRAWLGLGGHQRVVMHLALVRVQQSSPQLPSVGCLSWRGGSAWGPAWACHLTATEALCQWRARAQAADCAPPLTAYRALALAANRTPTLAACGAMALAADRAGWHP